MNTERLHSLILVSALLACGGCLPQLPENVKNTDPPQRNILMEVPGGRIETESGVENAVWLEIDGSAGPIGGYLSQNGSPQKALVIILHGASTFTLDGEVGSARIFHETFGARLHEAGFVTWSLAYQECGTPYGQRDLEDVVEAIDWLEQSGNHTLGNQYIYVAGYSTGGTLSILTNRRRQVSAAASVSGLTEPESIETLWGLLNWITGSYPLNLGACQMFETLNYYGPPGAAGWSALDTVSHFDELKSPMLLVHGTADTLFSVNNARDLERRYQEVLAAGGSPPPMEFLYLNEVNHFVEMTRLDVVGAIVSFFNAHQTAPASQ